MVLEAHGFVALCLYEMKPGNFEDNHIKIVGVCVIVWIVNFNLTDLK